MRKAAGILALTMSVLLLSSSVCLAGGRAQNGSLVSLSYFMEAGGVSVIPQDKKALMKVTIGAGNYPPAFEKQLIGLREGDVRNIQLSSDQAFGPVRQDLIKRIPKRDLPPSIPLREGIMLGGNGQKTMRIVKVLEDSVVLDENHPFAGKTLDYHVRVTDVE